MNQREAMSGTFCDKMFGFIFHCYDYKESFIVRMQTNVNVENVDRVLTECKSI